MAHAVSELLHSIAAVIPADAFQPEQWNNFFVLVGTAAAALTGLVFVAVTINLEGVARDATHKYRAINMLSGFTSAFAISAFALMGHQTYRILGAEWLVVSLFAAVVNTNGYVQAFKLRSSSRYALSRFRIAGGTACYLGQLIGSVMLLAGSGAGMYVGAIALIVNVYFLVSGSWLLILGTYDSANEAS